MVGGVAAGTATRPCYAGACQPASTQSSPLTAELPEGDDFPVGNVNFAEAESFCRRLTELADGAWVQPTIWTGLSDDASVVRDEIFGPCCHIRPFDSENEVVALANDLRSVDRVGLDLLQQP